jgi:uncharacterized metal-binding protein
METTNKSCLCNAPSLCAVFACSGASDLGELTDQVARRLNQNEAFTMKCLAMIGAGNQKLIKSLDTVNSIVIDGCPLDCGKQIIDKAGINGYCNIRLTDYGFKKGQTSVTPELVNELYETILKSYIQPTAL